MKRAKQWRSHSGSKAEAKAKQLKVFTQPGMQTHILAIQPTAARVLFTRQSWVYFNKME